MTPEQQQAIIMDLQSQVSTLRRRLDFLENSSTFPRNVETAINERLRPVTAPVAGTHSYNTQSIVISSTPQTISVPEQPSGKVDVVIKGVTFPLVYKF